ncbi:GUN4 domain-containing protein [Leptolyngbya sp. FACHB-36]|uniref:GUN4 domain-containing protein n=1 Tax=Leptolyngbya sp. FACHB-36 TaxID=2692808 RepID=UPI0016812E70|nr:GUN4 domain-containing protein [Leptolyngbya sp. FACHB-36]MBD2021877.1 GUN4 domain-containing protein [Leptolyngbya sp. FACHB-36]
MPEPSDAAEKPSEQTKPEKSNSAERRFVQRSVQTFVQWMPVGGSSWAFASFLLKQEWTMALLMFPVTAVTGVWAAYSKNFVGRLEEVYSDRGKKDADALIAGMDSLDKAIRWQLSGFETKYLKWQSLDCQDYKPEGVEQRSGIFTPMLREVFVPLELSSSAIIRPGLQARDLEILQQRDGLLIWDLLVRVTREPVYRQMAILAWGGYGKTTLMKHIAFSYAEGTYRRYRAPKLVPVLLYLRKWRDVISQNEPPSLPDLITKHHIPSLPGGEDLSVPPYWAKEALKSGRMLVMLDGFDEVAEGQRVAVSRWISAQMRQYDKSVFILTSRPGGYKQYSGDKMRTPLFVKEFNVEQRQRFVQQWYQCQERYARGGRNTPDVQQEAQRNAAELLQQIEERSELRDMAKNPLLLNMIATFHRTYPGAELPKRRGELYQDICTLQLRNRPSAKNIELLLELAERQEALQVVALEMMQRHLERISQEELLTLLQTHLTNQNPPVQPRQFLDQIVQVSELLVEQEEEYEFAHLSFQEYLAAAEIKRLKQESLLYSHFNDAWWRSTILLYASLANPTNLIQQACQQEAVDLAYACLRETTKQIDSAIAAEVEVLRSPREIVASCKVTCVAEIDVLRSGVQDLRYQNLENFLRDRQWREADEETYRLMITTMGKEEGQWFEEDDLRNFPCEDLRTLDQLWVRYSNGHFGFNVQKKIWQECNSPTQYNADWERFGDRVGWRVNGEWIDYPKDVIFDTSSPKAHLPVWVGVLVGLGGVVELGGVVRGWWGFFSRVQTCRL